MKVKLENIEVIEKLQMRKKEKDVIRITDLVCEHCKSYFELSYKIYLDKKENLKPFLCKKCRLSEGYKKGTEKRLKTLKERYGVTNNLHIKQVREKTKADWVKKYGTDNPAKSDEIKQKMSKTIARHTEEQVRQATAKSKATRQLRYGAYFSKEKIEKTERTLIEKYGSLEKAYSERAKKVTQTLLERYGQNYPIQSHKKYAFDGLLFDSSWELSLYIWLKDCGIEFEYHPKSLEYVGDDGKTHLYYPDFLINGKIVEIKGDHFFNEKGEPFDKYTKKSWKKKYDFILENGGSILRFEDMKQYIEYVHQFYGKNFLKKHKMKATTIA